MRKAAIAFLSVAAVLSAGCKSQSPPFVARDPKSQYELGVKYWKGDGVDKDERRAVDLFRKAAQGGNTKAMVVLGFASMKGQGTRKDAHRAVEWFTRAAEASDIDAQYNLGYAYIHGDGIAPNLAKAAEWFTRAAAHGDAGSMFNLGLMYLKGEGVARDPLKAYTLLKTSELLGNKDARKDAESASKTLTVEQRHQAEKEAAAASAKFAPQPTQPVEVNGVPVDGGQPL